MAKRSAASLCTAAPPLRFHHSTSLQHTSKRISTAAIALFTFPRDEAFLPLSHGDRTPSSETLLAPVSADSASAAVQPRADAIHASTDGTPTMADDVVGRSALITAWSSQDGGRCWPPISSRPSAVAEALLELAASAAEATETVEVEDDEEKVALSSPLLRSGVAVALDLGESLLPVVEEEERAAQRGE